MAQFMDMEARGSGGRVWLEEEDAGGEGVEGGDRRSKAGGRGERRGRDR